MNKNNYYQICLALYLGTMLFLSSCGKLKGEGGNIVYSPGIDSFISMDIDVPCHINISYGDSIEFTVEAQQNIIDNIYAWKESKVLYIELTQKVYEHNPITLNFTMPDFRGIAIRDVSDVDVHSSFTTSSRMRFEISGKSMLRLLDSISCFDFMYDCTGTSTLEMEYLDCERNFIISSDGESDIKIEGESKNSLISVGGELKFDALDFKTQNTDIIVTGRANPINVYASVVLEVDVSGDAKVRYMGNPPSVNITDSLGSLDIQAVE